MNTEVLAPAGSKEGLLAALYAGADAVYTGGRMFGARAYASNLSDDELMESMDYCHLHGKKLYLTINTLVKEEELPVLTEWIAPFYEHGLDAVIVQDLGVFSMLKREFPELELHGSTQMTVHSAEGAKLLEEMGASRVVPARELSLEEIRRIRKETNLEIECFVHGALCYCYSGQCLMSSLIGGRSGNRGRCAQPCRLPWSYDGGKEQFWLSPKDICTLEILPDILEAGVDSLKIEGRMKRTEYTAGVSAIYRKYVDLYQEKGREGYRVDKEDIRNLMDLYNRGGFSTGYYKKYNGPQLMSTVRQNHFGTEGAVLVRQKGLQTIWRALEPLNKDDMLESMVIPADVKKGKEFSLKLKEKKVLAPGTIWNRTYHAPLMKNLQEEYTNKVLQEKLNGKLMISPGKPAILTLISEKQEITISGAVVQEAQKQPVTEEKVRKQICKTGNTPYTFEKLDIQMEGACFLPLQNLNELRREALDTLEKQQLAGFRRILPVKKGKGCGIVQETFSEKQTGNLKDARMEFSVSLEQLEVLPKLVQLEGIDRIYLDSKCFTGAVRDEEVSKVVSLCHAKGISCWYILPAIFRNKTREAYSDRTEEWFSLFDGILVKNLEEIQYLREMGYSGAMASDYNLYSSSREAVRTLEQMGMLFTTCPAEQNFRELRQRSCKNSELLIYGRLPLMTSVQCLQKTAGTCMKTPGIHELKDRKGKRFPVKNYCPECYNVIYNSVPISLHQMAEEVCRLQPASLRLMFNVESEQEILEITKRFLSEYVYERKAEDVNYEFTRGHYKRGVE